jgi:hypothetical protein
MIDDDPRKRWAPFLLPPLERQAGALLPPQIQVRRYLLERTGDYVRPEVVELLLAAGLQSKAWLKKLKALPTKQDLLLGAELPVGVSPVGLLEEDHLREVLEDESGVLERWA